MVRVGWRSVTIGLLAVASLAMAVPAASAAGTPTPTPRVVVVKPKPKPPRYDTLQDIMTGRQVLTFGDVGPTVRWLQLRLAYAGVGRGLVITNRYDTQTSRAETHLQEKFLLDETGVVDQTTIHQLLYITNGHVLTPAICRQAGTFICVDKLQKELRLMSNGRDLLAIDARFGAPGMETNNGFFRIQRKVANDYSTLFNVPMYWSMYFSGGQAIHFSFYFKEDGYYGASRGCINTRDWAATRWMFFNLPEGTPVVVY